MLETLLELRRIILIFLLVRFSMRPVFLDQSSSEEDILKALSIEDKERLPNLSATELFNEALQNLNQAIELIQTVTDQVDDPKMIAACTPAFKAIQLLIMASRADSIPALRLLSNCYRDGFSIIGKNPQKSLALKERADQLEDDGFETVSTISSV